MVGNNYDIFVSYSRRDIEFCDKLNYHLSSVCGFRTFVDREGIEGGDDWAKVITDAVKSAEIFLLLISSNSLHSENVDREICLAINSGRKIIPIRLENVIPRGAKEYQLATIQLVDVFDKEHDAQLKIVEQKVTDRLGRKEAQTSSEAQQIREAVEFINVKHEIREKMGTQVLCQFDNINSIWTLMPFSIGPFGGTVKTNYNGKTLKAWIDLNGKYSCDIKWLLYQLLSKGFPEKNGYVAHTDKPCYDVATFFEYTINDMPLAPKSSAQCLDDITRVCGAFYDRIVTSLRTWISYSRDFRLYIEELDKDLTDMFPECEGWVISSKLSSYNGFKVAHEKTKTDINWAGLINANEFNYLLAIKIGSSNSYNGFHVGVEKFSSHIRLGAIEEKIYDICQEKLGNGEQNKDFFLYKQSLPEPFNRAFLVIERNGPQWEPWGKEQQTEFRILLRQKVEILKIIYSAILPELLQISPGQAIKINETPDIACWDQATCRSMLANLCHKQLGLMSEMEGIICSTTVEGKIASVKFQRDFGALGLSASAVISEKDFVFSFSTEPFLLDGQNEFSFPGVELKALPNQNTWRNQISFDGKRFSELGLTFQAWFREFENKFQAFLPFITQMAKTLQTRINILEKLTDSVSERLRLLFPVNEGWIVCNNAKYLDKFSKISIYKQNWTLDKDKKYPLMAFALEQGNVGFRRLNGGLLKGDSYKKLPDYVKKMASQFFLQQFSDHASEKLVGENDLWLYIYFKQKYENGIADANAEDFLSYVETLFAGLKKLSPLVDGCVAGIKGIEK